jgi:hypothetical protein
MSSVIRTTSKVTIIKPLPLDAFPPLKTVVRAQES